MGLTAETVFVLACFVRFGAAELLDPARRERFVGRGRREWIVDAVSLSAQGALIPAVRWALAERTLPAIWPSAAGSWAVGWFGAFALCFVGVDFIYYWIHRAMHSPALWRWHQVHHSAVRLDFAVSSRNSLLSHFLMPYAWALSALSFLVDRPGGVAWGMAATAGLDLWRHSGTTAPAWVARRLGGILILPDDHGLHHARGGGRSNYGANLALWDRACGTFKRAPENAPENASEKAPSLEPVGIALRGDWRDWLWPRGDLSK